MDFFLSPRARRHVNLFVEGEAAPAEVLRGAGATLSFENLRMGASLTGRAEQRYARRELFYGAAIDAIAVYTKRGHPT